MLIFAVFCSPTTGTISAATGSTIGNLRLANGTITDSSEGIVKSIVYALQKMGKEERDFERLRAYVGPSLKDTFQNNYCDKSCEHGIYSRKKNKCLCNSGF